MDQQIQSKEGCPAPERRRGSRHQWPQQQPSRATATEEDFWASLNGGASCVTIEGTDAIGTSPSIQQLADQLKANMEPTIVPTTMEPPATPKQKVPFEPQPEEPETVSLPSKLAQRFESVSPPPAPKFEINAATPPFVTQHFGASATPPPSVLLQSVPLQSTASVTS